MIDSTRGLKMFTKAEALALQAGDIFYAITSYGNVYIRKMQITLVTPAENPLDIMLTYNDLLTNETDQVTLVKHIMSHMTVEQMEGL